jgi:hypothetical protein
MSTDRSRTIAWVMWVSGLVMIALAAVLNEVDPLPPANQLPSKG